jgi:hypothetical protein
VPNYRKLCFFYGPDEINVYLEEQWNLKAQWGLWQPSTEAQVHTDTQTASVSPMVHRIFPIDAHKSNTAHWYSESALERSDLLPLIDATTVEFEEHAHLTCIRHAIYSREGQTFLLGAGRVLMLLRMCKFTVSSCAAVALEETGLSLSEKALGISNLPRLMQWNLRKLNVGCWA